MGIMEECCPRIEEIHTDHNNNKNELEELLEGYNIFSKETIEEVQLNQMKENSTGTKSVKLPTSLQHFITIEMSEFEKELLEECRIYELIKTYLGRLLYFYIEYGFYIPFLFMILLPSYNIIFSEFHSLVLSIFSCIVVFFTHFSMTQMHHR